MPYRATLPNCRRCGAEVTFSEQRVRDTTIVRRRRNRCSTCQFKREQLPLLERARRKEA